MIHAYTDAYLVELGDFGRDHPPMRPIVLTRFDGNRTLHGVIDGTVVKLHIKRVFKDQNFTRFKRSELLKLLYTEVV